MSLPLSPAEAVVVVAQVMVPAGIADRRWCASEPPLESRIKPSRRVGPSRGTDGYNPSPSSGESGANPLLIGHGRARRRLEYVAVSGSDGSGPMGSHAVAPADCTQGVSAKADFGLWV